MSEPQTIRLPQPETTQAGEADAGRMLSILWRGKWILLAIPTLAYLAARLWLGAQTELYVAVAQVQVDTREVNLLRGGAGEAAEKPRTVLKQQQQLLKSTALLKQVADAPAMQGLKSFAPERLNGQSVVGALYENLTASIDVESNRVILSFLSPDRAEAELVVGEALRVYIDYHKEKKRQEAQGLAQILRTEWDRNRSELETASKEISDLRAEHMLPSGSERTPLQSRLDNAAAELNRAHSETLARKATYDDMREASADPERFRSRGEYWRATKPIAALEERYDAARREREEKEAEYQRKRGVFGASYPGLAELTARIEELRAQEATIVGDYAQDCLRNSEVDYQRSAKIEADLEHEVADMRVQVVEEGRIKDRVADLEVQRTALRETIARFGERITELEVQDQTGALNLDVIEQPRAAVRPAFPEVEKTMVYALGGSAILAFAIVLLIGLSDRRIRDVEEVPKLMGTSVLGVLPQLPGGGDRARVARTVEEDPHSLAAEAFRSARTATIFALPGGRGVVLVSSASAGEGKSVCASNLAFALARAGKKTLLVDADMRKPAQHEIYGVANGVGLAGLLSSAAAVKKSIVPNVAVGLDLLPAGEARGKAAELCEAPVLEQLLGTLRASYECIVVDGPPVLETSEARVLAALSDVVVYVLRLDVTRAPSAKRAAGILRSVGARLLGVVPNAASSQRGARAYSGGISFGEGAGPAAPRARATAGGAGGGGTAGPGTDAKGRGTDFLGLEEESA